MKVLTLCDWTCNLLIWSEKHCHCATDSIILNVVVLTNITEKAAFCVHGCPTLQLCRLMLHDDNQLDNILFPAQGFLWYMFPTYHKLFARIRNRCISNASIKTDGMESLYCPHYHLVYTTSQSITFEPMLPGWVWFLVRRLNHSPITAYKVRKFLVS